MEILPIFYDHSSHKSLLTPWTADDVKPNGPQSFLKLAKDAGHKKVYFVSTNFYSFIEAWKNANKMDLELVFGLELWVCKDAHEKSEASTQDESKAIIWIKNGDGYKDAIKIYSEIYTDAENKYYHMRGSWKNLRDNWTDNLSLSIPFFDGFLHRNVLNHGSQIVPDLPCIPYFHREIDSGLPFARIIDEAIDGYGTNGLEIKTKTIYYEKVSDFKAWQVYRSIGLHSDFGKPEMQFCCSDNFSWEGYNKLIK